MNEESNHFNYYFIETKDQLYYLSNLPNKLYSESFSSYLFKNKEILLIDKSEKENDEYFKAYRIPTEKIIFYGAGYSAKSLSQDELDIITKNGEFKGKPLYRMI